MNGLIYTITLQEPVLANSLAGDTNSARSLPFIPGGLVRGALINAYLGGKEVDAVEETFQRLFLSGSVRYLHAYPFYAGERALPAPLSWKVRKHHDKKFPVFNFAVATNDDPDLKSAPFAFYTGQGEAMIGLGMEWQVNVHTQRDAVHGRARKDAGAVYRYEALPAGMKLSGVILAEDGKDIATLKNLLTSRMLLLGKARTAGYGRARIEIPADGEIKAGWREDRSAGKIPAAGAKRFILTFLSDAILQDDNGQCTLDPLPALGERLGAKLSAESIFRNFEIAGGFNRSWGLPLPQTQAIAARSVFVIEADQPVSGAKLLALEATGIGERLVEGFGRVSVSLEPPADFQAEKEKVSLITLVEDAPLTAPERDMADLMLSRLLRRELDAKVMSAALEAVSGYKGGVPNSQLSRWRVILRSALGQPDEKKILRLQDFFKKEAKRNSAAWQKMERARVTIGKQSLRLTEWLDQLFQNTASVWQMLGYPKDGLPVEQFGTLNLKAGKALEVEYALRLADAVLASMTKTEAGG